MFLTKNFIIGLTDKNFLVLQIKRVKTLLA
jgi:hypothetical protein